MSCPAPVRLAAAVSGEDDAILDHVSECLRCQDLLDGQRQVRALVRRMPDVPLPRFRRDALAAEVMARADQPAAPSRARVRLTVSIALAAAAGVAFMLLGRSHAQIEPPELQLVSEFRPPQVAGSRESMPAMYVASPKDEVVDTSPTPATPKARVVGAAESSRELRNGRDLVQLAAGQLTVDARGTRPVQVVAGDTAIGVKDAKVSVVAHKGVIESVTVFAGSAEVKVSGHREVIEAGVVWTRDAARDDALAAFRDGWTALRDGRTAEAIAAFDKVTHPIVAEEAVYWAAIASERAGDMAGAAKRYEKFIAQFPESARIDAARAALARLAP